jgi:hypothetical protein
MYMFWSWIAIGLVILRERGGGARAVEIKVIKCIATELWLRNLMERSNWGDLGLDGNTVSKFLPKTVI